jgi:ribosomal protein S18 acetylase RimI-like enzyme
MIRLTRSEIRPAAKMLAQAFRHDPLVGYLLPEVESREQRVFHWFHCVVQYGIFFGEVYATSSRMEGVAVWLPPHETTSTLAKMLKAGGVRLPFTAGIKCSWRSWKLQRHLAAVWRRCGDFPHWYLGLLGVAPAAQGRGHGSNLVSAMLDRCDSQGLRCCVDTANQENTTFYQRFGFLVTDQAPVPGTNLGYWLMVRE